MLILIKESETEQTVPSRWPYKCEISKLFYLPQTLLVNFFKLIPASESLLIPRRKLSNPGLQIFAFVTAPGANGWRCPPSPRPHFLCLPGASLALLWPHPCAQDKAHGPTPPELQQVRSSGESPQPFLFRAPPPTSLPLPLPVLLPAELRPSRQSSPIPREEQTRGHKTSLAFLPVVQSRNERSPGRTIPTSPSTGHSRQSEYLSHA